MVLQPDAAALECFSDTVLFQVILRPPELEVFAPNLSVHDLAPERVMLRVRHFGAFVS